MLGFRKQSEKYHFDAGFYLVVLAFAAVIGGVYYYGKRIYVRSRGAEVQALLKKENISTIEAFRPQAKAWVTARLRGKRLVPDQRKHAEEIIAKGLWEFQHLWTQDRIDSVSKKETDRKQHQMWAAALAELDQYIAATASQAPQ